MLTAHFHRVTSIKKLREKLAAATALLDGKIPSVYVRGTFETSNALLFADGSWYRVRNVKTVYCEIFSYDDGGKWVKAAYFRPFDIKISEGE